MTSRDTRTHRRTEAHLCTNHLHITHHSHTLTHILTHTLTSPKSLQGSPAAVAHPAGGGDVPENRGLWSHLKLCWVLHDINSHLAAARSCELGPGRRQAQTLWPLLGEQREALFSTAHPLTPTAGLSVASPQAAAGTWGWGGQGLAEGPSGSGEQRVWQLCGLSEGAPGCCAAYSLMAPQGWASPNSLAWATASLPLWSFSQLPRRPWGRVSRSPLVNKDGQCLPTESQGCGLGMPSTWQSLQANGLPGEILALGLALPSRGPGYPEPKPRCASFLHPEGSGQERHCACSWLHRPAGLFDRRQTLARLRSLYGSSPRPPG